MNIADWESASGAFMGLSGVAEDGKGAAMWLGERMLPAMESFINGTIGMLDRAANAIASGWSFFKQWFADDPIRATAGGAALLLTGAVIVSGGGAITAIGGGVLAIGAKLAALAVPIGATIKAGLSLKGIATLLVGGTAVFSVKRFLVDGAYRMYNFDWNITDQALANQQTALFNALAGQLGESLGHSVAALVCSSNPTINGVEVNTDLFAKAYYIMQDEDSDARDGVIDAFTDLVYFTRYVSKQLLFINSYASARRWVRENVRTGIKSFDDAIKGWGTSNQSWSFRSAVEEKIESIDNAMLQNFTEELVDEFIDSCYDYAMQ